jgi:alkylated DNA repair dioxygenase AlkB
MELIPITGAEIYYEPHFLQPEEASQLFNTLLSTLPWERRKGQFGHPVPRSEAYYGDPGTDYTYSRRQYHPLAWTPELLSLKARVEQATPENAYANWGLPKLGLQRRALQPIRRRERQRRAACGCRTGMGPVIASVSLGAERLFRLKGKDGTVALSEELPHGSLLIMAGETQKNFKHEVPKEPDITRPRINLTFRHIEHR